MLRLVLLSALLGACSTPSTPLTTEPDAGPVVKEADLVVVAGNARIPGVKTLASATVIVEGSRVRGVTPGGIEAPPAAVRLDADLVTPGFIDAHAHPAGLGRMLGELDLTGVPTYAEALAKVKEAASEGEGWLLGRGWDQNDWPDTPEGGWPLAKDLDALGIDRPILLRRVDGHAAWVNSAALAAGTITKDTKAPEGGRIIRGADGAPAGVLVDTAGDLVPVPEPTVEQVTGWLRLAQDAMLAEGLVGVHDMGVDDTTLAAYRALKASGELKIRAFVYLSPDSKAADELLSTGPTWGAHLSIVGIKAYADGALGSRGAHLSAPYADDPSTQGLQITQPERITELATACLKVRAQLAVHAIGDQAVTDVLDAFAKAREAVPDAAEVPLRMEHAQIVRPNDMARFDDLNVVASMQPTHATSDMPWAEDRLGPDRVGWGYAWRRALEEGAVLALGSDFPVESVDPALGLHAATTRTDVAGQPPGGWGPDQSLTPIEAIDGFTANTWTALGQPSPRLQTGHPADLTLWQVTGEPGPAWEAIGTVVDGKLVWPTDL